MAAITSGRPTDSVIEAVPTGAKRMQQWHDGKLEADHAPALDVAALSALFGADRAQDPQVRQMSFRIPAEWLKLEGGIKQRYWAFYEERRKDALRKWFGMLDSEGFDPFFGKLRDGSQARMSLSEGYYPAIDTLTGAALIGEAEVKATCWILPRKVRLTRFELTPDLVTDTRPALLHA